MSRLCVVVFVAMVIADAAYARADLTVSLAVSEKHPGKRFGMYACGGHVALAKIDVHPRIVVSVATAFGSAGLTLDELMSGWHPERRTRHFDGNLSAATPRLHFLQPLDIDPHIFQKEGDII